jgi:hypothetical protein
MDRTSFRMAQICFSAVVVMLIVPSVAQEHGATETADLEADEILVASLNDLQRGASQKQTIYVLGGGSVTLDNRCHNLRATGSKYNHVIGGRTASGPRITTRKDQQLEFRIVPGLAGQGSVSFMICGTTEDPMRGSYLTRWSDGFAYKKASDLGASASFLINQGKGGTFRFSLLDEPEMFLSFANDLKLTRAKAEVADESRIQFTVFPELVSSCSDRLITGRPGQKNFAVYIC